MTSGADGAVPSRRLELVSHEADELRAVLADGARAQHEAGDLQASRDSFERAYRLAERAGAAGPATPTRRAVSSTRLPPRRPRRAWRSRIIR